MQNGFEPAPLPGIIEDDLAHSAAVQPASGCDDPGAESLDDGCEPLAARSNELARDRIGVDDVGTELGEHPGNCRFAAGDSAGQPDAQHAYPVRLKYQPMISRP